MIGVLCSGGIDSTTLAHMAGKGLAGLIFADYGQPSATQEQAAVFALGARLGVMVIVVKIPMATVDEEMRIGVGAEGPRVVAARNLLLVSFAVSIACLRGWDEIWIGPTRDDWTDYPDCRIPFLGGLQACGAAYGIAIKAPLIEETGAEVGGLARLHGVDLAATWSCYEPTATGEQCGACSSCQRRARILAPHRADWWAP